MSGAISYTPWNSSHKDDTAAPCSKYAQTDLTVVKNYTYVGPWPPSP